MVDKVYACTSSGSELRRFAARKLLCKYEPNNFTGLLSLLADLPKEVLQDVRDEEAQYLRLKDLHKKSTTERYTWLTDMKAAMRKELEAEK